MIGFWNRKKLLTDSSSMEIARVTELLKANNIEYEVVTKRDKTAVGMMFHASMATNTIGSGGAASGNQYIGNVNFVYHIFVKNSDFQTAEHVIN